MKKQSVTQTDLVCLSCGNKFTIFRKTHKQKEIGHIKDLWCPICQQVTKYFEAKDISFLKWYQGESEERLYIKNLILEKEEENERTRILKKVRKR